MESKVSVIIPAYNAQDYIERSVRSVLGQTHENLELIVIDDGSDDNTADIVSRIALTDRRAHLIRTPNAGPALARNRGMEAVSPDADFVMFVDADDYIADNAIEYALTAAEKGAELVLMGFTILSPDGSHRDYYEPEAIFDSSTLGEALPRLYTANMLNQVWAKLFSAKLIRSGGLRFLDFRWGEDRLFVFDCLERALLTAMLPDCRYFYVMHAGESLISRYYDKKPEACCLADTRMQQLCNLYGNTNDAGCRYMFMKSIFSCMTNLFSPSCDLSYSGKREYVRGIITNPQVIQRSQGSFGSGSVKIMCAVMRTGCVSLNLFMFRMVALVGRVAPKLFIKLKHKK